MFVVFQSPEYLTQRWRFLRLEEASDEQLLWIACCDHLGQSPWQWHTLLLYFSSCVSPAAKLLRCEFSTVSHCMVCISRHCLCFDQLVCLIATSTPIPLTADHRGGSQGLSVNLPKKTDGSLMCTLALMSRCIQP